MAKRSDKDARTRRAAERAMDKIDVFALCIRCWSDKERKAYESAIRALKAILREVTP